MELGFFYVSIVPFLSAIVLKAGPAMLEAFVSSRIRRTLLEYLLAHPQARMYLRGLAKELGLSVSPLRRELKRLEQQGLLKTYQEGNLLFYVVDHASPLFLQLKQASPLPPSSQQPTTPAPVELPQRAAPSTEVRPRPVRPAAWRWPVVVGALGFSAVLFVVLGTVAYLLITNQQLALLTKQALLAPKAQVTVVETPPQPQPTGELRGSRWRLVPGGVGSGFGVGGGEDSY